MNNQEKIIGGALLGLIAGLIWESQRNPPKVYLGDMRVHHYQAGELFVLLGLVAGSPTAVGIGAGLFLHDINDVPT